MAQVKIADLVKKTTPAETDLMVIQDAGATKGITWSDLFSPIYNWIGNLATLKTTHKNTFVGVANELFDKVEAVEANNSLRQSGFETVTLVSNSTVRKRVNFAKPYTSKPKINVTAETSSPHRSAVSVTAVDYTGFDVAIWADWSGDMTVHWMAQP